jgi:hypothetical protein
MLPPFNIPAGDAKMRSGAARHWLSSLTLPAPIRGALAHVADAAGSGNKAVAASALEKVLVVAARNIDEASAAELRALIADLVPPPVAESPTPA